MKAIQLTIDEDLLHALDGSEEVKREGRSAVIRRATTEYLQRSRKRRIAEQYRRAYGGDDSLDDLAGWSEEGQWPED
ncbi:MAG TPA: hypothetical protein VM534_03375 [Thermoanaerobaculia bacterium]|nr:hypothetical protein [Thermoanaerobaculia bacterium]